MKFFKKCYYLLLETLAASLLRVIFTGKGTVRACYGNKEGKGKVRAG